MVLLNGVKYACERCIRGHRVSSCTHTDKPLTMIKRKGRPASQCLHCREQRKLSGTHISCACGKKGKSPGQHFASCLLHKNSPCTCCKEKKPEKKPKKKKPEGEDAPLPDSFEQSNIFIEDIAIPFEAELGLLDSFSPSSFRGSKKLQHDKTKPNENYSVKPHQSLEAPQNPSSSIHEIGRSESKAHAFSGLTNFANPPSDTESDIMESMFPLFPLVGYSSFSDSTSLPLSAISKPNTTSGAEKQNSPRKVTESMHSQSNPNFASSPNPIQNPNSIQNTNFTQNPNFNHNLSSNQLSGLAQDSIYGQNSNSTDNSHMSHSSQMTLHALGRSASQSNQSNSCTTTSGSSSTHQPKPLRASASFDGTLNTSGFQSVQGSNHNLSQVGRPRRPESALSVTSSSSNTSKQNIFEQSAYSIPKASCSAAFPPFNTSQNNSNDDFSSLFNPGAGFNDSRQHSFASDDDMFKNFHSVATPQSSLPSRQPSQSRRKSSLTRSTQTYHTAPQGLHTAFSKERASSLESSPFQANTHRSPSVDQQKMNRLDTYLREVAEESTPSSLSPGALPTSDKKHVFGSMSNLEQSKALAFDIPMYSELLEYTQN